MRFKKIYLTFSISLMSAALISCGNSNNNNNDEESVQAYFSVTTLNFTDFNDDEATLEAQGLRVFGVDGADLSADLEPEYITVSADSSTAWVSLQENNGIARIDLNTNTITNIFGLGFKNYGAVGNEIDASDEDSDVYLPQSWPNVFGMYQPDGIASFEDNGITYIISANEGDAREYENFEEETRVENVNLDIGAFPNAAAIQLETQLGRMQVTQFLYSDTAPASYTQLHSFGARSFSIWNGETGGLVFDSGNDLDEQANAAGVYPDGRSDAKGTEPENVTVGLVEGKRLAFIGLERADAVAVYDISDLNTITFQQILVTTDDDAPEGILFVDAANSPNASALLIVSNEASGNITVYQADTVGSFSLAGRLVLEGGEGAAEISAFDPSTNRLFVLNNGKDLMNARIDVVDLSDPRDPTLLVENIDTSLYGGGINSVAISNGLLAAAIEAEEKTDAGTVVVFATDTLAEKGKASVGALPDMITFTPNGTALITANEGEPNSDYSIDPLGSISILRFNNQ